jgi:rSAM/selenodomain-associated transferase 1
MAAMSPRVLGLFAKQPVPSQAKTRLAAATSPEWAAQVAAAFLGDLMDRLSTLDVQRVLAFAPPVASSYFNQAARGRFELVPQCGGDLGQRMDAFLRERVASGAEAVVIVGTDSPTLPLPIIDQAFAVLRRTDVVLGPAMDGGYYLVGCGRRVPPMFEGISWSGSTVLVETVARLTDSSWRLSVLPPWYDVDTLDDWLMLRGHLAAMRRAGIDPEVPRTEVLCEAPMP